MFQKFSARVVMFLVCGGAALANPAPTKGALDSYISKVARERGFSEDVVRRGAIETLRLESKLPVEDLERIGRGTSSLDISMQNAFVDLLKSSDYFKVHTFLISLGNDATTARAGAAFDAMAEVPSRLTVAKLEEIRFQELPYEIVRANLAVVIKNDAVLGRLEVQQQLSLLDILLDGQNARTPAGELVINFLRANGSQSFAPSKPLPSQVSAITIKKIDQVRFTEMPYPVVRAHILNFIKQDAALGALDPTLQSELADVILDGKNSRTDTWALVERFLKSHP